MFQRRNKPNANTEKQVDSKKPKSDIENSLLFKSFANKTKKENLFSNYNVDDIANKINVYIKQTLILNKHITKYILLMKTIDFCKNVLEKDVEEGKIVSIIEGEFL